jgi:hypothetical protein
MFDKKWIQIMGLAMSLPSTIFIMAWGTMELHKRGVLTQLQAVLLFLTVVCGLLFMMVVYAFKKK